ncbi:VOC family protein [Tumebacillus permanentifrigoris]|uniref:Catechol 2,3-dioxygenase-like lactoylglutathione lyase family enzyme n=1 Tax=Tumebacillus permanentifrigoris TaxID=378543 RepID=A0A316DC19_9BACL|nr:VOC family protein [Tumebacillus permanentifrigoris]PWK14899.1 catechol 2,3-dioxygenase-like lactoylglutathione lyase family enzyme [Tumebacillus permanentifrigoris]
MSFKYAGLDHVQVAVPQGVEDEVRRFYGELLGMQELEKPERLKVRGGAWFQCGAQQLHIGVEEPFVPAKKAHPAFAVHAIGDLRDQLLAAGVKVQDNDEIPGVVRFFVSDPWGNRLEFTEVGA